ncbi:SDR family oxidoreductase [Sphingobium sp. V4]|uniref:SDR family oxidoreductase n=1 Tax=Sphingobium sp. V4 TaxID=3038927 RepID=UPI00255839C1|nr:SDR family oxidoreductase [Sphingobium sp. V4]WIW89451.1 SDR family oxidoreductase [Sphingobium sp. V4]
MNEIFQNDLLRGKRILISGGGTGIGKSMGRRFASLGADLVICGRRAEVLEETASEIRQEFGIDVTCYVCDIRDAEAVEGMYDRIFEQRPVDVLINNAAANFIAQSHKLSARAADSVLGITLHGSLYMTLAAGRRWIESDHAGVVLSILSTSVITGRAFTTPSAMAKSALLAMTRSLAVEWGPRGIRCVAIGPGRFPTEGAYERLRPAARLEGSGDGSDDNPLGRVGRHEEIANLAAFLASDAGGYINGEMVVIDGGHHLRTSGAEDLLQWTDEQWDEHRTKRK